MPGTTRDQAATARPSPSRIVASAKGFDLANFPIVAIGASAGGLEACQKLLDALPTSTDMSFLLVQHLDPSHKSLMAELLGRHTKMTIVEAASVTAIEPNHLYVIQPGTYLAVKNRALIVSKPDVPHGARLPFDFLLNAVANEYGARAICIVLSGTGDDGSVGLRAISALGGLVIAQDPHEATFDGMPKSAIATGLVDLVMPVSRIAETLVARNEPSGKDIIEPLDNRSSDQPRAEIIEYLRTETGHDFTHYKTGTLQRRIERRMSMAAVKFDDMTDYLRHLKQDVVERDALAKDLLIHVTRFFRDSEAFEFLAREIIPDLVKAAAPERALRIWVAGCSTGEEAYSLAILFREAIDAANSRSKLHVFASDIEADAIATAREGLYGHAIDADISEQRLAKYFSREDAGYRVSADLRTTVVFTVQNILSDPPFSRLDFISCRNMLIYLGPDAQKKAIALFHFALNDGGMLFLGSAETVGNAEGRFEAVAKSQRIYRHIGRSRPGVFAFPRTAGAIDTTPSKPGQRRTLSRQATLGELCRQMILDSHAPAAVVINRKNDCLYAVGPIDRYLSVAQGSPTLDLLALSRKGIRNKVRAAVQQAIQTNARVRLSGGQSEREGVAISLSIDVQPFISEGEDLLLVCFHEETFRVMQGASSLPEDAPRIAELERELDDTRTELQDAIRNLEISGEEQKAINDETLSVNEEYQSTNEELLTSKEELQSLNEELTVVNGQLQETLEHQRTMSNDLQNVLNSTDIATVFLDRDLNIRFFTPATKHLFNVIPSDVGRPLADLASMAADTALLVHARAVLESLAPNESEIEASDGSWYMRRIQPYRTQDNRVEGVVITFADITSRRHDADALIAAKREAEQATSAKSRFLAAASHDLRQPLQTLTLVQGLLAKTAKGEKQERLVARFDETLDAMTGMLNALLNINQIDAGIVRGEISNFAVGDLLSRLGREFVYLAQAKKLELRLVPTSLRVRSDPHLIEQIIRNLAANALKYTKTGKVLIGCRHRLGKVSIEVWDTGPGIEGGDLQAIFDEYYQIDNAARETSKGLGLGLSIVKRLSDLLGHNVRVHSVLGKGSVFAIDIPLASDEADDLEVKVAKQDLAPPQMERGSVAGAILVVEDDPEVLEMLEDLLKDSGHHVLVAPDGASALELTLHGAIRPDIILADFGLPGKMDGVRTAITLREKLHRPVPVIILTGDISADTLRVIAQNGFAQLHKPVRLQELTNLIQHLLSEERAASVISEERADTDGAIAVPTIHIVDDDSNIRQKIKRVFEDDGYALETYESCEAFLESTKRRLPECLLLDAYLPEMSGLQLLERLRQRGDVLPSIMITGESDVSIAVEAMKAGVSDFIEKPIGLTELRASVHHALDLARDSSRRVLSQESAATQMAELTLRQHQIMDLVLAGHPSKNIAADLGISQRTVENHRAAIMKKTGSKSLPALARLAVTAVKAPTDIKVT